MCARTHAAGGRLFLAMASIALALGCQCVLVGELLRLLLQFFVALIVFSFARGKFSAYPFQGSLCVHQSSLVSFELGRPLVKLTRSRV
ncbi:MAG: hypothetical protein ACE5HE_06510 [Phycisphaerae bacterium]